MEVSYGIDIKQKRRKKQQQRNCWSALSSYKKSLEIKTYFGGKTFGFIDIALIPFYSMFLAFKLLGKLDLEVECPKILQWVQRCLQRESVSKNMPTQEEIYDIALEFLGVN